eukprot:CAMPEP_0197034286 /NCGR_PEP_ID=MMETSP1384-20130603/12442_1 /TAXON_ID=29189 /ORGANISM="Ammonia sp." /LENGTH=634 /DNA_ID=CAMNT_0042464193 /DNA_START=33 /DNA_END=1934 /DNA_ORIENTATION=+
MSTLDAIKVAAVMLHAMNSFASEQASIASNPNIIFVLVDDWGINDVAWTQEWDNTDVQTPFLSDLATTESVILSNYYVERVCTASRASFLTGRYPSRLGLQAGVLHQNQPFGLTRQVSMLSNEFQYHGYTTHIIGKWHLGYQAYEYTPVYRGFDSFYGFYNGGADYYTHQSSIHYDGDTTPPILATDLFIDDKPAVYSPHDGIYGVWWQRDEALKLLQLKADEQKAGTVSNAKPFLFYFALQASHNPRQAPDEYNALYYMSKDTGNYDRITMKAQTTTVDDAMKDIVTFIKDSGLWDNTLLVFGSDNGGKKTIGDNAPYRGYKNTSWEGGVRVPLFVTGGYLNEEQKGTVNDYTMHIVDWYPTLMSAAGLEVNYKRSTRLHSTVEDLRDNRWIDTEEMELDGIDMWQYIQGEQSDDDYFENEREILLDLNEVWCAHSSCGALRIGRFKYIRGNNIATLLPDYDGSDWDRSFVFDADAAETWCQAHKHEFEVQHAVTFDETSVHAMINSIGCQSTDKGCLFDLDLDPCEYYDLSEVYPEMVTKFQSRLDEFQSEATVALMGENNANELAPKSWINPRMVCANTDFWCPYQDYEKVTWEAKLYGNDPDAADNDDDDEEDGQTGTPSLNVFLYMCLW